MIKLQIIGYLGMDAEFRETSGGKVISFNVAHTDNYKDAQGLPKSRTTWVRCNYWVEQTGILPYLVKGKLVYVEGNPNVSAYLNKQNQAAASLEMRVTRVELLGGKDDGDRERESERESERETEIEIRETRRENIEPGSNVSYPRASPVEPIEPPHYSEPEDDLPF
jgi:single-strand DNA-binding protein